MNTNRLIIYFMLFGLSTASAEPLKGLTEWLIGDSDGVWTQERWEQYLGDSGKCVSGSQWKFKKDGKLIREICKGDKVVKREYQWQLLESEEDDVQIKIDDKAYTVERLIKKEENSAGLPPTIIKTTIIRSLRERQDELATEIELMQREF